MKFNISLKKMLWQTLQFIVIFAALSWILDYWRSPRMPETLPTVREIASQQDLDWRTISENEKVIVYFWGSWCGICRYTSPAIHQLMNADGYRVVSVAISSGSDAQIQQYLQEHQWQFPVVNDDDRHISRAWDVKVTPSIVILQNGKVRHITTGLSSYWGLKLRLLLI